MWTDLLEVLNPREALLEAQIKELMIKRKTKGA